MRAGGNLPKSIWQTPLLNSFVPVMFSLGETLDEQ